MTDLLFTLPWFAAAGGIISLRALGIDGHQGVANAALALMPFALAGLAGLAGLAICRWGRRLVHKGPMTKIVLTASAALAAMPLSRALT